MMRKWQWNKILTFILLLKRRRLKRRTLPWLNATHLTRTSMKTQRQVWYPFNKIKSEEFTPPLSWRAQLKSKNLLMLFQHRVSHGTLLRTVSEVQQLLGHQSKWVRNLRLEGHSGNSAAVTRSQRGWITWSQMRWSGLRPGLTEACCQKTRTWSRTTFYFWSKTWERRRL